MMGLVNIAASNIYLRSHPALTASTEKAPSRRRSTVFIKNIDKVKDQVKLFEDHFNPLWPFKRFKHCTHVEFVTSFEGEEQLAT